MIRALDALMAPIPKNTVTDAATGENEVGEDRPVLTDCEEVAEHRRHRDFLIGLRVRDVDGGRCRSGFGPENTAQARDSARTWRTERPMKRWPRSGSLPSSLRSLWGAGG